MKKKITFDLTTIYNKDRPLSWSAISSFEWNPKQWHDKYVLKLLPEITPELEFGSMVDKRIQEDPTYLPNIVRYPVLQHKMLAVYDGIPLLGYADAYRPKQEVPRGTVYPAIRDYKTGRKPWTQKRANETGQLTMYLAMMYLMERIKPSDFECYIDWMPTHYKDGKIAFIHEGEVHTFKTRRTMKQVIEFFTRIKNTWAAMEAYAALQVSLQTSDMSDF